MKSSRRESRRGTRLRVALTALLVALSVACSEAKGPRPNILLVSLDTTRVDHLSAYGYQRDTSPNLRELCKEAVRFSNCYATSSWTLPAHASMFTGKFPASHGAQYDEEGPLVLSSALEGSAFKHFRARGLAENERTLAQILTEEGYNTGAAVAGPWMKEVFGLGKGFQHYDDSNIDHIDGRRAHDVSDAAIAWLDENTDDPFFLFLNYYDPHGPFNPVPSYATKFMPQGRHPRQVPESFLKSKALYDSEILYMDEHLGRVFDHIKSLGEWENTWIIITADHGELIGEKGKTGHGKSLSEIEINIPLIIKDPIASPPSGENDAMIQQTDLLPMIFEYMELELPPGIQGGTLPRVPHPIIAEVYPLPVVTEAGSRRMIIHDGWKYVWSSKGEHELYELASDPEEKTNLHEAHEGRAKELLKILDAYLESLPPPGEAPEREIDDETRRLLEGHGYMGD